MTKHEVTCPVCLGSGEGELPCLNSRALEPRMGACENCSGFGWVLEGEKLKEGNINENYQVASRKY